MKEYFKGVVWPRESITEPGRPTNYRYVVVGMLVTDQPLVFEGRVDTVVIDSTVKGMAEALNQAKNRLPQLPVGDATMVLLSLEDL